MLHVAQVNVARLAAPLDSPVLVDFVANLEPVNARADGAPGFVWRLQTDDGDATAIRAFPDHEIIVNMSVWETLDVLRAFVYSGDHLMIFKRRREWFQPMGESAVALWWVPAGHTPTVDEARARLDFLRAHGPSPYAFTFATAAETPTLTITPVPLDDSDAQALIKELNAELEARYPEPGANHFRLDAAEVAPGNGVFLVAHLAGDAVACGALRRIDDGVGEVKRMYVAPRARGRKLGAAVLHELERAARDLGVSRVVLETGPRQREAIVVYERAGYERIEAWGEYAGSEFTVCYAKELR